MLELELWVGNHVLQRHPLVISSINSLAEFLRHRPVLIKRSNLPFESLRDIAAEVGLVTLLILGFLLKESLVNIFVEEEGFDRVLSAESIHADNPAAQLLDKLEVDAHLAAL